MSPAAAKVDIEKHTCPRSFLAMSDGPFAVLVRGV